MTLADISSQLTTQLGLRTAPIGAQPASAAPSGVPTFAGKVPSACSLWRVAEKGPFFAPAEAHQNCPIGTYTLGLPVTESVGKTLNEFIAYMGSAGYLDSAEVAKIPRLEGGPTGFVYGPLASFQTAPALALVWVTARQMMLLEEALGDVAWTSARAKVTGRPACAALAIAANTATSAASLGCAGMRTFTEVADDLTLVAIPGALLAGLGRKLQAAVDSNEKMLAFYRGHKATFPPLAAQSP
jgi:uncharacterized protein (DUF169 family)